MSEVNKGERYLAALKSFVGLWKDDVKAELLCMGLAWEAIQMGFDIWGEQAKYHINGAVIIAHEERYPPPPPPVKKLTREQQRQLKRIAGGYDGLVKIRKKRCKRGEGKIGRKLKAMKEAERAAKKAAREAKSG